jgi:hypothetical protein
MKVAIIGCGPAGLFAAEACRQEGVSYTIFGERKQSQIAGAQYLHREIPELAEIQRGEIDYVKVGTRDGYANKVYGNLNMEVSWDTFDEGTKPYWSLNDAYRLAWIRHEERINGQMVDGVGIRSLVAEYGLVVNTAPKASMCLNRMHRFNAQTVYLKPEQRHQHGPNTIVYNGQPPVDWYRWSFIDGFSCYEFSRQPSFRRKQIIEIKKPTLHFCDCHEEYALKYLEVGRFGRWAKKALTHEAYYMTLDRFYEMQ